MRRFTWIKEDPCRPPAWRWELAGHLFVSGNGRMSRWDDPWIRRTVYHLRGEDGQDRWARRNARPDPAVAGAIRIARGEHSLQSLRVEAGVLARRKAEEIAEIEELPVETIEAYEALFYDIRSKLHASTYIRWSAIGRDSRTGEIGSWPAFVRQMAYDGGPPVLDAAFQSALPIPPGVEADPLRVSLRCLWLVMSTPASAHSPLVWKQLENIVATRPGAETRNLVDPAVRLADLVARSPAADPCAEAETAPETRRIG